MIRSEGAGSRLQLLRRQEQDHTVAPGKGTERDPRLEALQSSECSEKNVELNIFLGSGTSLICAATSLSQPWERGFLPISSTFVLTGSMLSGMLVRDWRV